MTDTHVSPAALAAGLAARLIHDISGPASGIASGMELYAETDSQELRNEGLNLAAASGEALLDVLAYCRVAFGGGDGPRSGEALGALAQTQFAGRRARLAWSVDAASFSGADCQVILILTQIAAAGLPSGGEVRVAVTPTPSGPRLRIDAEGTTTRLQPEAVEGLAGQPLSTGLAGRWAPAYLAWVLTAGDVAVTTGGGVFALSAGLPG